MGTLNTLEGYMLINVDSQVHIDKRCRYEQAFQERSRLPCPSLQILQYPEIMNIGRHDFDDLE